MIQIESIHIEEFRGIRDLDLQLNCKSFVVYGPNGSGKSGVVDGIDFALTGNIARLSGPGTGGVTVLRHAPHVSKRTNPEAAKVSLGIRDTVSGQSGILTRTVKTAGTFTLTPDTPELRAAVANMQEHAELTLSRREIIRFVIAEASNRAQEVQALLRLERIGDIRKALMTARNKCSTAADYAGQELGRAENSMQQHLGLSSLKTVEVSVEVNKRRAELGLPLLDEITIDADLQAGIASESGANSFHKQSAIRDVQALTTAISNPSAVRTATTELIAALGELTADPTIMVALQHRSLVEAGLGLVTEPVCPLCDMSWENIEALKEHLRDKLQRSDAASELEDRILLAASTLRATLLSIIDLIRAVMPIAARCGESQLSHRLQAWSDDLASVASRLGSVEGIAAQQVRISTDILEMPSVIPAMLTALHATLEAKSDQTAADSARAFLTIAQERWERVRIARADHAKKAASHATAKTIYEAYCTVSDEALSTLYKTVENDFSAYYQQINADDESTFRAQLAPSSGKLDLSVDFYGIGMFPPVAYHSEGHQDGMGVCLYLALVKQIFGEDFRFAVLDDVVMSVDRNHRRQFCSLLKDTFPAVQFIITTHDDVWARQMQASGLIGRAAQARFHGWTIDGGPICEQGGNIWDRIDTDLANDDIPGAAHKLRRYLEATSADLADMLHAQVTFRADASYDLGQLMNAVNRRHGELLKKAATAANSWKNAEAEKHIQDLKNQRARVIPERDEESWAINKLVHNNDWAVMCSSDFTPVLHASKKFLDLFTCTNPDCNSWIYVVGQPREESVRCGCGTYHLNLRSK